MSADRMLRPEDARVIPRRIDEIVREAVLEATERATRVERQRCADVAALYPLECFAYDCANTGELLRLRDTISEAILKGSRIGERIA